MNNQKGFTLVEMLIVLLVITVLLFLMIPNISQHSKSINNKGCEAFVDMVQGQVQAYEMDHQAYPTSVNQLKDAGYISKTSCPNGDPVEISSSGVVSVDGSN
ncbi:prepilin-type N-terminal cleavage/methylation domain-containing protein [Bacillus ginsengihumi]|uniref:ComG operon protein 3 n=2 Tax=Heyndrickxia ginsengihumi TaxID=363870 RepID=A0A0A6V9L0_9BACI|nr:competence type IV pilus major pilin ComGC [Heyndrickxia ginsengihumi]KHD84845.1 competence protein ComG [Heyndrickxia ginsengihumi]MBE6183763.1 prepilin-type N-terminal cleavage/methylation domain-containing protein [Bacillus sp. (in: firmicutes)]MCM3022777.1 prepilin-type N-terminal cleavage/methylation domain-containing protein [Heyndrickxia ginsengihumi]NEY20044.1 prepilin-type N-terminal cleavage/methylation domain-containing protein [Heyndrickxia ginsengihumi]